MKIAIKRSKTVVDEAGSVVGHEAGDTLVRRLLRLFPDAVLIGPVARRGPGTRILPIEAIDPEAVVINMDVIDSLGLWNSLYEAACGTRPKIMNFVWFPVGDFIEREQISALALSCALFPTFANSERTAGEVREVISRWTVQDIAQQARLAWVNLGFRLDHVKPREETQTPVVLYPAIYVSARKRPDFFMDVLEKVEKEIPLRVEMRLDESHLVSAKAMDMARPRWVWTGPLLASRDSYWEALARTTALLATSLEESYGLMYVEAMGAGVVAVLPDLPWARVLVPEGYPFFYPADDAEAAQRVLTQVLRDTATARGRLDELVGGSFVEWIQAHHSDDTFDREIISAVGGWFPEKE